MAILEKYETRVAKVNSLVCVGLDSDLRKLPERFHKESQPQAAFNKYIIDATAPYAAAFKPNIAFYEARGATGLAELKTTMEYLQEQHPDVFTICDCKRADIGSTNEGYVEELYDWFGFDAVTVHPYLGKEALKPFLIRKDKMVIVLCRTSNSGSGELQNLSVGGRPLWQEVLCRVRDEWNEHGNCALVMGATYPKELQEARTLAPDMTFLVPGVGAQGGSVEDIRGGLRPDGGGLIINSSRGIIFDTDPAAAARQLRDGLNAVRGIIV